MSLFGGAIFKSSKQHKDAGTAFTTHYAELSKPTNVPIIKPVKSLLKKKGF